MGTNFTRKRKFLKNRFLFTHWLKSSCVEYWILCRYIQSNILFICFIVFKWGKFTLFHIIFNIKIISWPINGFNFIMIKTSNTWTETKMPLRSSILRIHNLEWWLGHRDTQATAQRPTGSLQYMCNVFF